MQTHNYSAQWRETSPCLYPLRVSPTLYLISGCPSPELRSIKSCKKVKETLLPSRSFQPRNHLWVQLTAWWDSSVLWGSRSPGNGFFLMGRSEQVEAGGCEEASFMRACEPRQEDWGARTRKLLWGWMSGWSRSGRGTAVTDKDIYLAPITYQGLCIDIYYFTQTLQQF